MRIRDWSSDVCSSDLERFTGPPAVEIDGDIAMVWAPYTFLLDGKPHHCGIDHFDLIREGIQRSEEHTSDLQPLMRISYAVFCLKKTNIITLYTFFYFIYNNQSTTDNSQNQYAQY